MDDAPESTDLILPCPQCQQDVEIPSESVGQLIQCPHCSHAFFASPELKDQLVVDDTEEGQVEETKDPQSEIDNNRIKQLVADRKALNRQKSFLVIGLIFCAVTMAQLAWNAYDAFKLSQMRHFFGYTFFSIAAAMTALFLINKIRHRPPEDHLFPIDKEKLPEPDFSTLSDGSERWRKLEEMTEGKEQRE